MLLNEDKNIVEGGKYPLKTGTKKLVTVIIRKYFQSVLECNKFKEESKSKGKDKNKTALDSKKEKQNIVSTAKSPSETQIISEKTKRKYEKHAKPQKRN